MISMPEFLVYNDDHHFVWDDACREHAEEWLKPVKDAGLDSRKHKVFHHANKEYLKPPSPFVQHGPELGDSGSTIVYKVTSPEGQAYRRPLALKVIVCKENTRPPGPDSEVRKKALEEVRNMAQVRHPHIVAYVASFEDYCIQTKKIGQPMRRNRDKDRDKDRAAVKAVAKKLAARSVFVAQQIKKHILGIAMYPPAQCNLHNFMMEAHNYNMATACFTSSFGSSISGNRDYTYSQNGNGNTTSRRNSKPPSKSSSQATTIREDELLPSESWMIPHLHTYFGCLAQAVAYLHKSEVQIRHKDIKPENVVIDQFGLPLLTDFGLSKHFESGQPHSEGPTAKTWKYADPETWHETQRDTRSDVFSLGCVYLEMATVLLGRPPSFAEERLRRLEWEVKMKNKEEGSDGERAHGDHYAVGGGGGRGGHTTTGGYGSEGQFTYAKSATNKEVLDGYLNMLRRIAEDDLRELAATLASSEANSPTTTSAPKTQPPQQPTPTSPSPTTETTDHQPPSGPPSRVSTITARERSIRGVLAILDQIAKMMSGDFNNRPYARQLYDHFRHLYDVYPGNPGPCVHCDEERKAGTGQWPATLVRSGSSAVSYGSSNGSKRVSILSSPEGSATGAGLVSMVPIQEGQQARGVEGQARGYVQAQAQQLPRRTSTFNSIGGGNSGNGLSRRMKMMRVGTGSIIAAGGVGGHGVSHSPTELEMNVG